jgi:predicted Zn finger-like uncharacterized protein
MLLTTCPQCAAQFKVTPDQLNVRQGRVMCGRCRQVFNAFQSLERIDSAFLDEPVGSESLGGDTDVPAEIVSAENEPALADPEHRDVHDNPPYAEALGIETPPFHGHEMEPASGEISAAVAATEPESGQTYESSAPPETLYADEDYAFDNQPIARSKAWGFGVFLAAILLTTQSAFFFRSDIVSGYPQTRPYFAMSCELLGCALQWSRDTKALKIESSDLIEEVGKPGSFLLTATLLNRSASIQDFPWIELSLTDTNNQTLTRRVVEPHAYLGRPLRPDEGMKPGTETNLNLHLEAATDRSTGYHLLLFYP